MNTKHCKPFGKISFLPILVYLDRVWMDGLPNLVNGWWCCTWHIYIETDGITWLCIDSNLWWLRSFLWRRYRRRSQCLSSCRVLRMIGLWMILYVSKWGNVFPFPWATTLNVCFSKKGKTLNNLLTWRVLHIIHHLVEDVGKQTPITSIQLLPERSSPGISGTVGQSPLCCIWVFPL